MLWIFDSSQKGCCGLGWLRTKKGDPFNTACCQHDARYEQIKRGEINFTFKEADAEFYRNLLRAVDTAEFLQDKDLPELKLRARLYYNVVRNARRIVSGLPVI